MAASQQQVRAAKLKLVAIIAVIILTPALAVLLLDGRDDLQRHGWSLLVAYLLLAIAWPASLGGDALYRLSLLPASPARLTLDRLLVMFCVLNSGEGFLTWLHPNDLVKASGLITFTILFVALGLCGLFWPLDAPPIPARLKLIPRWVRRSFSLALTASPLPLVIWLMHTDWLHSAGGGREYGPSQFLAFLLAAGAFQGLRWSDRVPGRPTATIAPAEVPTEAAATQLSTSEAATTDAAGERGVLLSRSSTTGRWEVMCYDLWLFPNGILRIPLGWAKSLACVGQFYDARHPTMRTFDPGAFARATTDPRNQWIPREAIASATMHHRSASDELRLTLTDGRSLRLLWLPSLPAYGHMQAALDEWLGVRLVVR
ncbi:MAG TPA: hypothetical protein VFU88_16090 [Ktedonobacterales bacterium]|nr:hypothetical protein [Ktedonobacterales bacterium]